MSELTQASVHQLLQVLDLTRKSHQRGITLPAAYQDAIRDVANRHRVAYQTIGDLCRRRLGLNDIDQFRTLLSSWFGGDKAALRAAIRHHSTPAAYSIIDQFFQNHTLPLESRSNVRRPARLPEAQPSTLPPTAEYDLRLRIDPDLYRRIRLAHLAHVGESLEDTAVALIAKGFESEKTKIRELLESTVGAS